MLAPHDTDFGNGGMSETIYGEVPRVSEIVLLGAVWGDALVVSLKH